jgi:hypothetical protein
LIYATFDFGLAAFFLFWTHVLVGWTYGEEPAIGKEPETEVENGMGDHSDDATDATRE